MSIGSRLADECAHREMSHAEAAEIIGVSQATFSRWVNGDNLPTSPYFTKLARFLRTPRDELAGSVAAERAAGVGADPRTQSRIHAVEAELDGLRSDIGELKALVLDALKQRGRR